MICFQYGMKAQVIFVCSKLWLTLGFLVLFCFVFLLHCMQDLCSLTRDITHSPWIPMANLEYKHEGIYSSLVIKGLKTPYMDFYCQ